MDDLIRLCRKAANEWRNTDAYYQASVLIDSLCDRLEETTAKPQTNADRIRAMSDEELAGQFTLIAKVAVNGFADYDLPDEICDQLCSQFLEKLKQPVKDGEGDG